MAKKIQAHVVARVACLLTGVAQSHLGTIRECTRCPRRVGRAAAGHLVLLSSQSELTLYVYVNVTVLMPGRLSIQRSSGRSTALTCWSHVRSSRQCSSCSFGKTPLVCVMRRKKSRQSTSRHVTQDWLSLSTSFACWSHFTLTRNTLLERYPEHTPRRFTWSGPKNTATMSRTAAGRLELELELPALSLLAIDNLSRGHACKKRI